MSTASHGIDEIEGSFTDISAAAEHLKKAGYTYQRMHFNSLRGKDVPDWIFDRKHLDRFQDLVKEATKIRTEKAEWEARLAEWEHPEAGKTTAPKLKRKAPAKQAQPPRESSGKAQ